MTTNTKYESRFIKSVRANNIDEVKLLIDLNANIDYNGNHSTLSQCTYEHALQICTLSQCTYEHALRISAECGYTAIVKMLIDKDIDVNTYDDYPLILATKNNHIDIVKLLLENDANLHTSDEDGYSDVPLRYSAEKGNIEMVKLLLEKGADVRANNYEALLSSARNGHKDVVELLLKHGAKIMSPKDYESIKDESIVKMIKANTILTIEEYVIKVNMLQEQNYKLQKQLDDIKQIIHQTN